MFVLPVDANGLPNSYLAAIEEMFNTAAYAKFAYVYIAQPSNIKMYILFV